MRARGVIADARRRADDLCRSGLTGTHGEVLVLRHHLAELGVQVAIGAAVPASRTAPSY